MCMHVRTYGICINFYFLKLKKENKKPPPHIETGNNIKIVDNESIGIFFVAPSYLAYTYVHTYALSPSSSLSFETTITSPSDPRNG